MNTRLQVSYREIEALKPRARNPRTHSPKQIGQIADSIKRFGFTNPVLIDARDEVIAGHGRLAAAKLLGLKEVPTIRLEDLSEAEVRAYVIADNRLAETPAGTPRLALELRGSWARSRLRS
jgi:ParB-like chromosome segregation protein Spo0J